MSCCGAQNLDKLFGSCIRCTIVAGLSSLFLWVIYFTVDGRVGASWVTVMVFGFACIVSVMFFAHLLGHADNMRQRRIREVD